MGRKIKCYLAFASFWYRVILFAVVPIAMMAWQISMVPRQVTWAAVMGFNMVAALMLLEVEVFLDYWTFGGLAAREGMQLTFLKTSTRGLKFLKTALGTNLLRQLLTGFLPVLLGFVSRFLKGGGFAAEYAAGSLAYIVLGYVFLVIANTITRFFDGLMFNFAAGTIAVMLMALIGMPIMLAPVLSLVVLLLLSVVVSVVSVRIILHRVKESFYDKAD